jgi:2-dehydro-3-deoxy-D-arabinonate dehydratase
MSGRGVWRVLVNGEVRLARGSVADGPSELLPAGLDIDQVLDGRGGSLAGLLTIEPAHDTLPADPTVLAPIENQDVWAAGVTYERSRTARNEESGSADCYDKVYVADRPELFFKASARRVRGTEAPVGIREDSTWDVPEPELGLVLDAAGSIVGYVIGNDMSSRSIEGENPLYLPQAKVYTGSCAIGPCLVPIDEAMPIADMEIRMTIVRDGAVIFEEAVSASDLRRKPVDLADWLFRGQDFPEGVILLTGTSIVPTQTLVPGDHVSISIAGLGTLSNEVELVAASARRVTV